MEHDPINIRKPNLFVIGAMKAGTTSVCRNLALHKDVFMAPVKETFYFSNHFHHRPLSDYLRNFEMADRQRYVAEGTADYASFPKRENVAARIYLFNPEARFIYLLRDPIDRAISHYKHFVLEGREQRSLTDALKQDPAYLWLSYYAVQLRVYLTHFPSARIFVGAFENYKADPLRFLNAIYSWLGIAAWAQLPGSDLHANQTALTKTMLDGQAISVRIARSLPLLRALLPQPLANFLRRRVAPKRHIDFSSEDFRWEVARVKAFYGPMVDEWGRELRSLCDDPESVHWDILDYSYERGERLSAER